MGHTVYVNIDIIILYRNPNTYFVLISVPPNGLVIYCGTIVTEEGKEKKVNIDFEPFKPINTSLYLCDNKVKSKYLSSSVCNFNLFLKMNNVSFYKFISLSVLKIGRGVFKIEFQNKS